MISIIDEPSLTKPCGPLRREVVDTLVVLLELLLPFSSFEIWGMFIWSA